MRTTSTLTTIAGDHNTADLIARAARELRALPRDERAAFSAASLELAAGALLYLGGSSGPTLVDAHVDQVAGQLQALAREVIAIAQTKRAPLEQPAPTGAQLVQQRLNATDPDQAFEEAAESLVAAVGTLVALADPASIEVAGALAITASDFAATTRHGERQPAPLLAA